MKKVYYIGFDIHKKSISYCIKMYDGKLVYEGKVEATREALTNFGGGLRLPWIGAMEATMFTGWIFDLLRPCALEIKVAHPEMLKAITAGKHKNDRLDAEKIVDLLRCDLLPECYMFSSELRELRRILRYRNMIVAQAVRMKNKTAGLLMEVGAEYNKKKLHGRKYFDSLLENLEYVPESVINLLRLSRSSLELFQGIQKELLDALVKHPEIKDRVRRLTTIPGVGSVTALTWVLEIGDPHRFKCIDNAISYCGLCGGQNESAGKSRRGPISKKRNKHLQTILVEAAHLAPRWNEQLAEVYARKSQTRHKNTAVLEVARKLVAYLLAVDKRKQDFKPKYEPVKT